MILVSGVCMQPIPGSAQHTTLLLHATAPPCLHMCMTQNRTQSVLTHVMICWPPQAYARHGSNWLKVSEYLPMRSPQNIKNQVGCRHDGVCQGAVWSCAGGHTLTCAHRHHLDEDSVDSSCVLLSYGLCACTGLGHGVHSPSRCVMYHLIPCCPVCLSTLPRAGELLQRQA